ncbi:hypothetical protein, partial [Sphingomonas endophytica]|uniref:hypothetical protein n=1 Tax=Sphingomonas endophytica TaxID=869719 RepID=UPI0019D3D364
EQEVRKGESPQVRPVLEALIRVLKFAAIAACIELQRAPRGALFAASNDAVFRRELAQFFKKTCVCVQTKLELGPSSVLARTGAASPHYLRLRTLHHTGLG